MTSADEQRWHDVRLASAFLTVDPVGTGGACVTAAPGPARDIWLSETRLLLGKRAPWRRLPVQIADDRLAGGLDLAATLGAKRPIAQRGVLAEADGGVVLAPMAERLDRAVTARLIETLDTGTVRIERDGLSQRHSSRIGLILLDESLEAESGPPPALLDRLAFHLQLPARHPGSQAVSTVTHADVMTARERLASVQVDDSLVGALCAAAQAFGIRSPRAGILAYRVMLAAAALVGRDEANAEDAECAARLVLSPRAVCIPAEAPPEENEEEPPQEEPEASGGDQNADDGTPDGPIDDLIINAVHAAVPPGLLERLTRGPAGRAPTEAGTGGATRSVAQRGRRVGVRRGMPRGGQRLNVIETLRAAAPWQTLRRPGRAERGHATIDVRRDDFRLSRLKHKTTSTTIFALDASGSTALQRLGEAKGAVELLLADSYVRRDQVAVIAFRGHGAELLLPPTRSLTRAKRELARLPGGGGTPLAAGLDAAWHLAVEARRRGQTPTIVVLTDGKANIDRDGRPNRECARVDANASATRIRYDGIGAIVIDVSSRPQDRAGDLAHEMGARYVPLPHADARALSVAVQGAGTQGRASP